MLHKYSLEYVIHHLVFASPSWIQAAELAPSLQTDMEVKDAIQGAIQGENGEVVQIVSSVATWENTWLTCSLELSPPTWPDKS